MAQNKLVRLDKFALLTCAGWLILLALYCTHRYLPQGLPNQGGWLWLLIPVGVAAGLAAIVGVLGILVEAAYRDIYGGQHSKSGPTG